MRHTKWIIMADDRDYIEFGLTKGQVGIISKESLWVLEQYNFHASWNETSKSYFITYRDGKKMKRLHRLLMDFPDGLQIDHKNNNTLDNRLNNLRIVTGKQNIRNLDDTKNKFGLVGISYYKRDNCFTASITNLDGKHEQKSFSVNKYGYDQALQMAKDHIMSKRQEYGYFKF